MARKLLLVLSVISVGALVLSCVAARPKGQPLIVDAYEGDGGCVIVVNGERVDSARLLAVASAWPSRQGIVRMKKDTPYRCVGGVVFTLQRAGVVKVQAVPR